MRRFAKVAELAEALQKFKRGYIERYRIASTDIKHRPRCGVNSPLAYKRRRECHQDPTQTARKRYNMSDIEIVFCERERPRFRQFCHLNQSGNAGEWTKTLSRTVSAQVRRLNRTFDIDDAFHKLGIEVKNPDESKTYIPIAGLAPRIEIVINWTDLPECKGADSFWDHEIRLYGFNPTSSLRVSFEERVDFGQTAYNLDLSTVSPPNNRLWEITRNGNELKLSSGISLKDENFVPGPLPSKRIPPQCRMIVVSAKLIFDSERMYHELANLKLHAMRADEILIKSSVLHGHLVDRLNGSVCQVSRLAQTLTNIEGRTLEELENLSYSSKKAIQQAVSEAVTAGGIPKSDIPERPNGGGLDYWNYFKANHQLILERCAFVGRDAYVVSTRPFVDEHGEVLNQRGFQNAKDYEREKYNLMQYVIAAWAIAEAAGSELAEQLETEWLNRGFITVHLGNDS